MDVRRNPALVSRGVTANQSLETLVKKVERGEVISDLENLVFRDPNSFCVGELHNHVPYWEEIACVNPSEKHEEIQAWIRDKVSILPFSDLLMDPL